MTLWEVVCFIQLLDWVSENAKKEQINPIGRAGLGYDFKVVLDDDRCQYIEVKSSKTPKEKGVDFHMSDFEFRFACDHPKDYVIYYVSSVSSKPEISVFTDLIVDGEFDTERFSVNSKSEYSISADILFE